MLNREYPMNKRPLQITMAVLGAIPVITGILTMLGLSDPLYASAHLPANVLLDSNLRFFGGTWLGLGLAVWWLVPAIEKHGSTFRILWGMIFLGGIGRAISMIYAGLPPAPFIGFTLLELLGAPLLIAWQYRIEVPRS
jgi:Domain of unknown function (DUF4345)